MSRIAHPGDDHHEKKLTVEEAREVAKRLVRNVERMYTDHYETFELLRNQLDELRLRMQNEKPIRGSLIPGATDAVVKTNVLSFLSDKDLANLSAVSKPLRQQTVTFEQAAAVAKTLYKRIEKQYHEKFCEDLLVGHFSRYRPRTRVTSGNKETKELIELLCHPALVAMAFSLASHYDEPKLFTTTDPKYAVYVEFLAMYSKDASLKYPTHSVLNDMGDTFKDLIRHAFLTQIVTGRLRKALLSKDTDYLNMDTDRARNELRKIADYINKSPVYTYNYTEVRVISGGLLGPRLGLPRGQSGTSDGVCYNPYLVNPVCNIEDVIKPLLQ